MTAHAGAVTYQESVAAMSDREAMLTYLAGVAMIVVLLALYAHGMSHLELGFCVSTWGAVGYGSAK